MVGALIVPEPIAARLLQVCRCDTRPHGASDSQPDPPTYGAADRPVYHPIYGSGHPDLRTYDQERQVLRRSLGVCARAPVCACACARVRAGGRACVYVDLGCVCVRGWRRGQIRHGLSTEPERVYAIRKCSDRNRRSSSGIRRWTLAPCDNEKCSTVVGNVVDVELNGAKALSCLCASPPLSTSAPGLCAPMPHLHRDWPHPFHICTRAGPTLATSALGPGVRSGSWHVASTSYCHHCCPNTGATVAPIRAQA